MRPLTRLLWIVCLAQIALHARADEPADTSGAKPAEELTGQAKAIAEEMRASLGQGSEARAMLEDILKGSNLSADDGWFPLAKVQNRFDWSYAVDKYDTNSDAAIDNKEFAGSAEDFARLDRNGDGAITAHDFDWSKNSLTPTPGLIMFFMADRDANGKLTQDEFMQLYHNLAGDGEYLAIDDLRDEFQPAPPRSPAKRADKPSPSTLVVGLKNQEIGSLQPGPNVGDLAPDFTLQSLDGEEVTLSKVVGQKPIVLIFGNFTCGPFRSQAGNIEKLYGRYKDRANFYLVYVREAHPSDGWWMSSNQRAGIDLAQPKDLHERRSVAATCKGRLDLKLPFLVDDIDDRVGAIYSGMPNRLYVIDQEGRIAFKNGRGPFGFHPRQLEQSLVLLLNESSPTTR